MASQEYDYKHSLILAGGGMRLAYHAGVLLALEEAGIRFNHVDGTSGGIFGTAMLASGLSPAAIALRWRKLNLNNFVAALPFKKYLRPFALPAMASATGIREKVFPALGIDISRINAFNAFTATFNVCNFSRKTVECLDQHEVTEAHLIAGMSLPIFMPALQIGTDWYTDAVWIKDANLLEAIKRDAEEIWLIWCIGNTHAYLDGSFLQYVHMIEMSANGGLFAELQWLKEHNEERLKQGRKEILLHIIKPAYALPLDPDFFLHHIDANTLINMGYEDTINYLTSSQPFDLTQDLSNSTTMKSPGSYVHFRQRFTGKAFINGTIGTLTLDLAFFVRETSEGTIIQQFSSLALENSWWVSGYNNTVNSYSAGQLNGELKFIAGNVQYHLQFSTCVYSQTDLLLGLAFKTARIILTGQDSKANTILMEQSAANRIKNAFYLNVHAPGGWWKRVAKRYQLLKAITR